MLTKNAPPNQIYDMCPVCNPQKHIKTTCTFINQIDEIVEEYLYQCDKCSAQIWVSEQWAVHNQVTEVEKIYDSMKHVYRSLDDFSN